MSELKACPWCQRPATLLDPATTTVPLVACVHDDCPLNEWMTVGEWNNRRADDAGRLREELDEAKRQLDYMAKGIYRGNTIEYIYDKAKCYGDQVMMAFNDLRLIGFDKGDANGNRELETALMKWAKKTKARLASLPASPSAEPCQKCGGHPTVKCLHCLPAPAKEDEKPRLTGKECRICAGKMVDFNAHYDRCFSCNAPEPKPAQPGEGGL